MKNHIIVTGGAGFVGSNLINLLIKKTNKKIISIDNYSTGTKKNHIKNKKVKYISGNTANIKKYLFGLQKKIDTVFHFGEFARIYQSFLKMNECINSNSIGSNEVFNFCLKNKIKLIYSATSATVGNKGNDKNLSPYAFTKAKNLEMLDNLKNWFKFKFEVIYFYNVYGPNQIGKGNMATVIGIFENCYLSNKPLTVVKPGTQSRKFTHIDDTVEGCFYAWKKNLNRHYSISNNHQYTILQIAKMFGKKIILINKRKGERYKSSSSKKIGNIKIFSIRCKLQIKEYIKEFISNNG